MIRNEKGSGWSFSFLTLSRGIAPVLLENIFLLAVQALHPNRELLKFLRELLSVENLHRVMVALRKGLRFNVANSLAETISQPGLYTASTPVTKSAPEGRLKLFRILVIPE